MFDNIEFDDAKDAINRSKHGLSLADFKGFDGDAQIVTDDRSDYGEMRLRAFGRIDGRGFMVAFTWREDRARILSFRRARDKELRRYGR